MTDFQKRVREEAKHASQINGLRKYGVPDETVEGMFLSAASLTVDEVLRMLEESRGEDAEDKTVDGRAFIARESLRIWLIERLRG